MPKISIITVNYNNLGGLKKTIESVKNQTYQDFEYVLIDGGSTDGSAMYLESHKVLFDYYVSEPDNGVYHAMNKGIQKATGEYLIFLNSGDHFFSKLVLEQNHLLLIEKDIIYFNLQVVEDGNSFIKSYPKELSFSYFVKDTLPHPATFIKKEAFLKTELYKEDFKIASDWKFFIDAICIYNLSYKKVNTTLSTFYLDGISAYSENIKVIFNEKQEVLNKTYPAYLQDLEEVIINKDIVNTFRKSKVIKTLVKLGFLNKF